MREQYEVIIGLEIHLQLKTKSKMFSAVANDTWQSEPNSLTTPVELGLPGSLPVPNLAAIDMTQRFGVALNCTIAAKSKFDRKNYFYPDLPKGYQISQYDQPFCADGYLEIELNDTKRRIQIRRIHLEEDTGKSMHKGDKTYLDFNKAGTPLLELVTEPDLRSADEASEFAKLVQIAARKLDISNADMEKGQMRLEANVSVRKIGEKDLPNYRIELKNINSFKFMRDAIEFEVDRQIKALEAGETLEQETRGWNEEKGITVLQRRKEDAHDYRYFPEPDIPPFEFDEAYIANIKNHIPEMPWQINDRLRTENIRPDYARLIAFDEEKYVLFCDLTTKFPDQKEKIANILANTKDVSFEAVSARLADNSSSDTMATDDLEKIIRGVLSSNPDVVNQYKAGKTGVLQFLIGSVMKEVKGRATPIEVKQAVENALK